MTRNPDRKIFLTRAETQNPYAYLNGEGGYDVQVGVAAQPLIDKDWLLKGRKRGFPFARKEIEGFARTLQNEMWLRRSRIVSPDDEVEPMDIVDPVLALKAIGYSVVVRESLGQHVGGKDSFEVAGIVDNESRTVELSRHFKPAHVIFTAAHELGHAILHQGSGLHRDRAPDGSSVGPRDAQELEADAFASFFLLPGKQVRIAFKKRFLTEQFTLTEATAFALASTSLLEVQQRYRSIREFSRALATAQSYNGAHFKSLSDLFMVSPEVMAIRIEELGLLEIR